MATLTLGQMLDVALGSSRAGLIDFEQLYSLLNGMLLHLGLRDLPVQENGEPLEGAEESPFSASFLKELKQKVEANEKEIAEVRALCQELREEVDEVKLEQSYMAEDLQNLLENFDMEEFQNMLDDLRNQLMESIMSAVKDMLYGQGPDKRKNAGPHPDEEDDSELIVIGNEITLVERPKTPRHGDSRPASPLPPDAKAQGRGKEASSEPVSTGENDTGQNVGQSDMGQNRGRSGMGRRGLGQRGMRRNVQWSDAGQNDMGQEDVGWNMGRSDMGQRDMGRNVRWRNRGRNDMVQDDTGQDDVGQDDMGQKDMGRKVGQKHMRRNVQWSDAGQNDMGQKDMGQKDMGQKDIGQDDMRQDDMGQMKDEEIEIHISEVEALPSPLDSLPEMTNMGEIKEEDTKMSISKAPPPVQKKSSDGGFTTSGMHPGAPGTHIPVQRVQSVRGHPGSQNLWIPAESVAGTSSRFPTSKEARGEGSLRMEAFPAEAGLMLLKVPSSEYSPCDQLVQLPGRHSEVIPSTPPASPGLSMRLPLARRQEHREQAAEGYSRRSPMYSGGKHTSVSPVQPMEPLLPDPNKPGTFELMGRDGIVYRGRTPPETD